jgi:hypothetical protein
MMLLVLSRLLSWRKISSCSFIPFHFEQTSYEIMLKISCNLKDISHNDAEWA